MSYRNDQHQQNATPVATDVNQQGQLDSLVQRFAGFVDDVEYSVSRAEGPYWCAVYLSAGDADDLLPAFREVLRRAQGC